MNTIPINKNLQSYKIARYWVSQKSGVKCVLCPHNCLLQEDEVGICRTRVNKKGKLIALTYAYPCAQHIDPIEKKPLYHFLPGSKTFSVATVGCNLSCLNCQNYSISQGDFRKGDVGYVLPKDLVLAAKLHGCESVSYTYTDPVAYYEYALDTAIIAKEAGLKNVIVSAGYIHKKPLRELCQCVDAANIDLKYFDSNMYKRMSGVQLSNVLDSLQLLLEEKVWLEITNLIVPQCSDDILMIERMCRWLMDEGFAHVPLHFSKFHPSYKLQKTPATPISIMEDAYQIAKGIGLKYVYLGNVGNVKQINTYCNHCNALAIERLAYEHNMLGIKAGKCIKCGGIISGVWV